MRAAAWGETPGFAPSSAWGAWRKPQPRITFERDSEPEEWAWEAVGLDKEEPPRFNWIFMFLIMMLTSCPALGLGLFVLLGG